MNNNKSPYLDYSCPYEIKEFINEYKDPEKNVDYIVRVIQNCLNAGKHLRKLMGPEAVKQLLDDR